MRRTSGKGRPPQPDRGNGDDGLPSFWDVHPPGNARQVWVQRNDAFECVRLGDDDDDAPGVRLDSAAPDTLAERLHAARVPVCAAGRPSCPRLLPGTFGFCPFCGAAASPPPVPDDGPAAAIWCAASGGATVPVTLVPPDRRPGETIEPAIRDTVPAGGPFLFAMAGTPPVTLALDMGGGGVWRPRPGAWRRLDRMEGGCRLPSWSRTAAALDSGLVVPLDDGALWFLPGDPHRRRIRCTAGAAVGGAAAVDGTALVPVRTAGRLALAWLTRADTRDGGSWRTGAVAGGDGAAATLGKPAADPAGGAVWAGTAGFLSVRVTPDGPQAVWQGWPDGLHALPWCRPHTGEYGTAHQLVRGDAGYRAAALPLPGPAGTLPASLRTMAVDGPFASTGDTAFHQHRRYRTLPWRHDADDFVEPGRLVLPLMVFRSGRGARAVRQILFATAADGTLLTGGADGAPPAAPGRLTLFLHRPAHDRALLLSGLPAGTAHDLQPFLLDGRLCLYDELGASWHRWTSLAPRPAP